MSGAIAFNGKIYPQGRTGGEFQVDYTNLLFSQSTTSWSESVSYTAIVPCIAYCRYYGDGSTNMRPILNGTTLNEFEALGQTNQRDVAFILKKGDTLAKRVEIGQSRSIYFSMNVYPIFGGMVGGDSKINYSTNEQVIGTWIDGKPLYQKTFTQQLSGNSGSIDISSLNAESAFIVNGYYDADITKLDLNEIINTSLYTYTHINTGSQYLNIDCLNNVSANSTIYITIQYTKTTD